MRNLSMVFVSSRTMLQQSTGRMRLLSTAARALPRITVELISDTM